MLTVALLEYRHKGFRNISFTPSAKLSICCARPTYIDAKVDRTGESNILGRGPHSCVREEESHGRQSTDNHGIPSSKYRKIAQISGQHRAEDADRIGDHVVAPGCVC